MKEVMTVNFNRGLRVILKSMKTQLENKANKVDYLRKDLIKSLLLSLTSYCNRNSFVLFLEVS